MEVLEYRNMLVFSPARCNDGTYASRPSELPHSSDLALFCIVLSEATGLASKDCKMSPVLGRSLSVLLGSRGKGRKRSDLEIARNKKSKGNEKKKNRGLTTSVQTSSVVRCNRHHGDSKTSTWVLG